MNVQHLLGKCGIFDELVLFKQNCPVCCKWALFVSAYYVKVVSTNNCYKFRYWLVKNLKKSLNASSKGVSTTPFLF